MASALIRIGPLDGAAEADGETWEAASLAELAPGETLRLTARKETLIYGITLPFFEQVREAA